MKNMRSLVMGVVAIALVCGVAWVLRPQRQAAPPEPPKGAVVHRSAKSLRPKSVHHWAEPRMARVPVQQESLRQESPVPAPGRLRPKPVEPQTKREAAQARVTTPDVTQTQDTPADQETIQDSMAQIALGYVHVDPNAEMYWDEATGDPSLSAEEPEGVMGDWNEDDPSDPEGSTTDDLP